MNEQQFLSRLFELTKHRGSAALNQIQDELNDEEASRYAASLELALNSEYKLQRIVRVPAFDHNGDRRGDAEKVAEYRLVKVRDLAVFAKAEGTDRDTMQAVAEGRAKEVKAKEGGIWRSFPFVWHDNTPDPEILEERERDMREDAEFRAKQATRQANKQAALSGLTTSKIWKVDE